MPVKRCKAKQRPGGPISWRTISEGERRYLLDLPHPSDATFEQDSEMWGLAKDGSAHRKADQPTLRQLFLACEADIHREWPHGRRRPSYLHRLGLHWTH